MPDPTVFSDAAEGTLKTDCMRTLHSPNPGDATAAEASVLPPAPRSTQDGGLPAGASVQAAYSEWRGGLCTLHWAGEEEVLLHQLHALGVHELVGGQDLAQHALAGAERLQNLSKTWATCTRHSASGPRSSLQQGGLE